MGPGAKRVISFCARTVAERPSTRATAKNNETKCFKLPPQNCDYRYIMLLSPTSFVVRRTRSYIPSLLLASRISVWCGGAPRLESSSFRRSIMLTRAAHSLKHFHVLSCPHYEA